MLNSDNHAVDGPALHVTVRKVRGTFNRDIDLQAAIMRLTEHGSDRAGLSLAQPAPALDGAAPGEGTGDDDSDVDVQQVRTLLTGMAGYAGAAAVAGAVIATGGALGLAAAGAVVTGLGAGVVTGATDTQANEDGLSNAGGHDAREALGHEGRLVLTVCAQDADEQKEVAAILQRAGATGIRSSAHDEAGISSAGWTG